MQALEFGILDKIQVIKNPLLDKLMVVVSGINNYAEMWIVIGVILFALYYRSTKKQKKYTHMYLIGVEDNQHAAGRGERSQLNVGVTVLLSILISAIIVNMGMKPYIARIRPYDINTAVDIITSPMKDFSFPSGHSSASFAAATAIFLWNKKIGIAAILLAAIIAFSRLYLYLHYPTDVIAGILIGIVCGLIARFMHRYVVERF